MEMISKYVEILNALADRLEPRRNDTVIMNDMFEAAADWRNFGKALQSDERYDLRCRIQQEEEMLVGLKGFYGDKLQEDSDYAQIIDIGAKLVQFGHQRKVDPDGEFGTTRIIGQIFAFLTSEFGMVRGAEPWKHWEYASDRVLVELGLPTHNSSGVTVNRLDPPTGWFFLEDFLFMAGRSVSFELPPEQEIATEADVEAWFTTVANVFRDYGADVLADKPGAFDRLAAAQAERNRLITEENDRLYGSGHQEA